MKWQKIYKWNGRWKWYTNKICNTQTYNINIKFIFVLKYFMNFFDGTMRDSLRNAKASHFHNINMKKKLSRLMYTIFVQHTYTVVNVHRRWTLVIYSYWITYVRTPFMLSVVFFFGVMNIHFEENFGKTLCWLLD